MWYCNRCKLKKKYKISLVGNPNVGKSSIFNMLTNRYVEVSNYPGTSIAVASAHTEFGMLVDTPGVYSLLKNTQITKITKEYIANSEIIVNVVNALTLERDLLLTKELLKENRKLLLVVNQIDEAERAGIIINYQKLTNRLGVTIIHTVATKGIGKKELIATISEMLATNAQPTCFINSIQTVQELVENCVSQPTYSDTYARQKLDKVLLHPIFGSFLALVILYTLFKILGVLVAENLVDNLVSIIDKYYIPVIYQYVSGFLNNELLLQVLIGEFGVLTMVPKIILGILLPLIIGFYLVISLLEDSGYIPRLAVLTSRIFNFIGLNGEAVIPVLLGFGCGAMGTISTRMLATKKERIIATAIIGVSAPCAAQQGIIFSLLSSANDFKIWIIYLMVILIVTVITGSTLKKMMKENISDFIIDIPPMRAPSFYNCYKKTLIRIKTFVIEAVPIFIISSIFISILYQFEILDWIQLKLSRVVVDCLRLPKEFADVFVLGLIRRDMASIGVFNLSQNLLTSNAQLLTATIVISLFVPCINAIITIIKEIGWGVATSIWMGTFVLSILVGSLITRICAMCL